MCPFLLSIRQLSLALAAGLGWSPFPGNINQLVIKLSSYVPQLQATGGNISEFVNPKYKDATKTAFKSSTRLECMMQDYPKALPANARVGFTVVNQVRGVFNFVFLDLNPAQLYVPRGSGRLLLYYCCWWVVGAPQDLTIESYCLTHTACCTAEPVSYCFFCYEYAPPVLRCICMQVWATYSPVKNSPADARAKAAEGNPTHSATTGEMDIYKVSKAHTTLPSWHLCDLFCSEMQPSRRCLLCIHVNKASTQMYHTRVRTCKANGRTGTLPRAFLVRHGWASGCAVAGTGGRHDEHGKMWC